MPPSTVRADRNIDRSGTDGNGGAGTTSSPVRNSGQAGVRSGRLSRPCPPNQERGRSIILRNGAVDVVRAQDSGALFAVPCTG